MLFWRKWNIFGIIQGLVANFFENTARCSERILFKQCFTKKNALVFDTIYNTQFILIFVGIWIDTIVNSNDSLWTKTKNRTISLNYELWRIKNRLHTFLTFIEFTPRFERKSLTANEPVFINPDLALKVEWATRLGQAIQVFTTIRRLICKQITIQFYSVYVNMLVAVI